MDVSKVFTVFDKNGNEKLVFIDKDNKYFDFDDNELEKEKLDLDTLRYFSNTLKKIKYCPSFVIEDLYNKDRNKLIDADKILIGAKCVINDLKTVPANYYLGDTLMHDFRYKPNLSVAKMGLYIILKENMYNNNFLKTYKYKLCENILDGKKYIAFYKKLDDIHFLNDFGKGFEFVFFDGRTLKNLNRGNVISKKEVNELAYSLRKKK